MAFYKNNNGVIFEAHNFVLSKNYELKKEYYQEYKYPIDGWYWMDTSDDAYSFFGIEKPKETDLNTGIH